MARCSAGNTATAMGHRSEGGQPSGHRKTPGTLAKNFGGPHVAGYFMWHKLRGVAVSIL